MKLGKWGVWPALAAMIFGFALCAGAQVTTAVLQGHVADTTGGAIPAAKVTATNTATGLTRAAETNANGDYVLPELPVGTYSVSVEHAGFQHQVKTVVLLVGQFGSLNFTLPVGEVSQKVVVQGTSPVLETTKTQVSTVITQHQIENLPVNGRDFISFTLLSPAVQIGDTTSGSTDVIVEPVLKISFAGQNIHDNFIAVDGADDISTVSGWQRGTPPQESVREFRVINSDYTTDFGRAVGGIVNIITKSGTNDWHGSVYEYFRNGKLDAVGLLQAPGLNILRQNQFGASIGGPLQKNKTFIFANYEGQRRGESPFYNKVVLANIGQIDTVKTQVLGLPTEPAGLNVLRVNDTDNGFIRLDHSFSDKEYFFTRYFVSDDRLTNQSPLNDGFDLPSGFKNNFIRDQSLMTNLTSNFTPHLVNVFIAQFARRSFDFPTVSTQPHLEVSNTFTLGVNRGNPDFYRETRWEGADNLSWIHGNHTVEFGGDFNWLRSRESFPLFYPFEADFGGLGAFLGNDGAVTDCATASIGCPHPFVIFFERFQASSNFTEPTINPAIYQGGAIPQNIRNQAEGVLDHTYNDFFIQDKWRATSRLTMNIGLRYGFETWPSAALDPRKDNLDPRVGLAYDLGTSRHVILRAGFGMFHGIIPAPLLGCQIPSCGGTTGQFPGRAGFEDSLNSTTQLFAYASFPDAMNAALNGLLNGTYPDATPSPFPFCGPTLAQCGFLGDAVIVRFADKHQNPYGVQSSLTLQFEPVKDTALSISYLHVKGVHLGSFFNINQPDPSGQVLVHTSGGATGLKNVYFSNWTQFCPTVQCSSYPVSPTSGALGPGLRDPAYAVYFEAAARWNSQFDGLLVNLEKRFTHHFSYGISYTWSKTIDDGPNPSFVLIPQDSQNIRAERALSADDLRHRFVFNGTLAGPTKTNVLLRDYQWSTIVTLQSPMHFTKFAGFDANGDVFGGNDRVGLEPRDTFRGDALETVDLRMSRAFPIRENMKLEFIAEAFNLLNKVNIRFFNTAYGAADFCPQGGPTVCGPGPFFFQGSPNPSYGTPRAVFNPRQLQFALRLDF
jgi:Carboxypeptidase regulatory-like domain